jgi:hypothetical protein
MGFRVSRTAFLLGRALLARRARTSPRRPLGAKPFDTVDAVRKAAFRAAVHRKNGRIGPAIILEREVDILMTRARREGLTDAAEQAEHEAQESAQVAPDLGTSRGGKSPDLAATEVARKIVLAVLQVMDHARTRHMDICAAAFLSLAGRLTAPLTDPSFLARLPANSRHFIVQALPSLDKAIAQHNTSFLEDAEGPLRSFVRVVT